MPLTSADIETIGGRIKELGGIRTLEFGFTHLTDECLEALAIIINAHPSIKVARLNDNQLSEIRIHDFNSAIANHRGLEILDLRNNPITSNGMKSLGESVGQSRSIKELLLDGAPIDDVGVAHIYRGLLGNNSLTGLTVSNDRITSMGMLILWEMMLLNSDLHISGVDFSHAQRFRPVLAEKVSSFLKGQSADGPSL